MLLQTLGDQGDADQVLGELMDPERTHRSLGHAATYRWSCGPGQRPVVLRRPFLGLEPEPTRHRRLHLLGEVRDQPGGPGDQDEATHERGWEADVGERGAAGAGTVHRKELADRLRMRDLDRPKQPQVRTEHTLLAGDLVEPSRPRIAVAVDRMTEAGHPRTGADPIGDELRRRGGDSVVVTRRPSGHARSTASAR